MQILAAMVNAAAMLAIKRYIATNNDVKRKNNNNHNSSATSTIIASKIEEIQKQEYNILKLSMEDFESALGKIKKKNVSINNPNSL